jgi:O-antigen/teichoic acid export membrane protein
MQDGKDPAVPACESAEYAVLSNPSSRSRNIVRGIGSLSVQGIVSSLLGFVLLASLLRLLTRDSYSAYSSLQVSVGIAFTLGTFGLSYAIVKFLASSSSDASGLGWGVAKASLVLTVSFSGVASLALAAVAPYLSDYFMKSQEWSWVFYLGALWLFSSAVASVLLGLLQALRRYRLLAEVTLASRFLAVTVAVATLILYQSLEAAILAWVLYYGATSGVVLILYHRPLMSADSRPHYRAILRYAAPLGLAAVVVAVAANADIIVVGGYLNPLSLGVYNATVVVSSIVFALFLGPLTTALFAETSFSSETPAEVAKGVSLALRFIALAVLPASLFASAMAPQLFDLFSGGGTYIQGIPYLQLITLFYTFYAVQAISIYVLQGIGKTKEVLIIGVITALGELGISIVLVPSFGLAGAAYSRVTIMILGAAVSLYFMRDHLTGVTNLGFLSKALISSALPALAVLTLSTIVSDRVLSLVPYTITGVLLYLGCARALNLLNDEDKSFVAHLLPEKLHWIVRML